MSLCNTLFKYKISAYIVDNTALVKPFALNHFIKWRAGVYILSFRLGPGDDVHSEGGSGCVDCGQDIWQQRRRSCEHGAVSSKRIVRRQLFLDLMGVWRNTQSIATQKRAEARYIKLQWIQNALEWNQKHEIRNVSQLVRGRLHWFPMMGRNHFKICLQVYKAFYYRELSNLFSKFSVKNKYSTILTRLH